MNAARPRLLPAAELLFAAAVIFVVARQLDPFGAETDARAWAQGPGLTVDEMFNVQEGARLSYGLRLWALGGPVAWTDLWRDAAHYAPGGERVLPPHLADHPPLGRLWLGIWHDVSRTTWPGEPDRPRFTALDARLGSAVAFALTVLLVTRFTRKHAGPLAGFAAGTALVLMPRPFGHAHIASLETITNLVTTAVILHVAGTWRSQPERSREGTSLKARAVRRRTAKPENSLPRTPFGSRLGLLFQPTVPLNIAALSGLLWGLAMLTKIQAILLVPPLVLWALWRFRLGAVAPLLTAAAVGGLVFLAGWPWLWLDPLNHLAEYFGRTTDRIPIKVLYFDTVYDDVAVPWHYPWVMTWLTTPWSFLILAALPPVLALRRQPRGSKNQDDATNKTGEPRGVSPGIRPTESEPPAPEVARVPSNTTHPGADAPQRAPQILLITLATLTPLAVFSRPGTPVYDGCRLFLIVFPFIAVMAGSGVSACVTAFLQLRPRLTAFGRIVDVTSCLLVVGLVASAFLVPLSRLGAMSPYWLVMLGDGHDTDYWGSAVTGRITKALAETAGPIAVTPILHQFQNTWLIEQSPALRSGRRRAASFDELEHLVGREPVTFLWFSRAAYIDPSGFGFDAVQGSKTTLEYPPGRRLVECWEIDVGGHNIPGSF